MNKLSVLKEFERVAAKVALGTDELRLYLLILAASGQARAGAIAYRTIRDALGGKYSLTMLQRACRLLSKEGLIEILSLPLEEMNEDSTLTYRILPPGGSRGR